MCGIVGYIGYDQAVPILINGLKKLEYRGYDSAGIAIHDSFKLKVIKSEGKLQRLIEKIDKNIINLDGNLGIGHTRWATHGEPSEKNAHPHLSQSGKFAVVQNGIVENYLSIKNKLEKNGVIFNSDTDTEVIAQLLEYFYDGDLLDTIVRVMEEIRGSYALGILCKDKPDELIAVKKACPLIIGVGMGENFISSDVAAIVSRTKKIIRLDDNEFAIIKKDNIKVYNKEKNVLNKQTFIIDWDITSSEKSGYEHFMLKEIMEQPKAITNTINPRLKDDKIILESTIFSVNFLSRIKRIYIIACGSAYYVGCVAKYLIEKLTKIPVDVCVASEFRYMDPIVGGDVLVIAISQSGETADTLAAVQEAKKRGSKVLSIVNVVGSSIANASDEVLYTWAGPEIAVATTKAYSTQLSIIYMLAIDFSFKLSKITESQYKFYIENLKKIPDKISEILKKSTKIKDIAKYFCDCDNCFFIGRNVDYATALEGSLKLKEISYIHSEACPAGELKHGTISLVEKGTLVVALATNHSLFEKMVSNIKEVKARGATVFSVATDKHTEIEKVSDFNFFIPDFEEFMLPLLTIVPLQLFSYYIAVFRKCNIDQPRNLAKSVTVE